MHFRPGPGLIAAFALCFAGCHDDKPKKAVASAAAAAEPGPSASAAPTAKAAPAGAAAGSASAAPVASAPAAASGSAASKSVAKGAPGEAEPSGPEVKLLSAGAAPHKKLRYHLVKGKVEKFKLTSQTAMDIHVAGHAMPAPSVPTLEMIATIKIGSVTPDGVATRDLGIDKMQLADADKVPSAARHSVEDSLSEMAKLKGHDRMDARGRLLESSLDTSGLDEGQVKQMMQSMATAFGEVSAPFPEEAIGKGARWQVTTQVQQMGMKMKQVAIYTLEKLDGDHGTTRVKLKQSAPGSQIHIPGIPLKVHSDLLGMTGSGTGEVHFDLGHSLPSGTITTRSQVKVRTKMAGRSQDTQMDMTLHETFTRL